MTPQIFEQWKNCIINVCKINLNTGFAEQRLSVYQNPENNQMKNYSAELNISPH